MAQQPIMPPALRAHLDTPVDFWTLDADQVAAAADLVARAAQVKRLGVQANDNLLIAQHRDRKHYARRQSGDYVRPTVHFQPGDLVYVFHKPDNATSMRTDPLPLKITHISDMHVATLQGRSGQTIKRHVQALAPCHLTDVLFDQQDDLDFKETACQKCHLLSDAPSMVLCEGCDCGQHIHCFDPPVASVPDGDWWCVACRAKPDHDAPANLDQHGFVTGTPSPVPTSPSAPLDTPTAPNLDPPSGSLPVAVLPPGASPPAPAVASAREERSRRRANLPVSRRIHASGWTSEDLLTTSTAAWRTDHLTLPTHSRTNPPLSPSDMSALCNHYMHGSWPAATITNFVNEAARQAAGAATATSFPRFANGWASDDEVLATNRSAYGTVGTTLVMTLPSEIDDLLEHVDFASAGFIVDPWAGACSIEARFRTRGLQSVISNDLNPHSPAPHHLDALQPPSYDSWALLASSLSSHMGAVVTSPHWAFLDLAIGLAVDAAEEVACLHVPPAYLMQPPSRRRQFFKELMDQNRLFVLQCRNPGTVGRLCTWLVIFSSASTRQRLGRSPAARGDSNAAAAQLAFA